MGKYDEAAKVGKEALGPLFRAANLRPAKVLGKADDAAVKSADDVASKTAKHTDDIVKRGPDGNPLPTKDLKHPNDDLLDRNKLDELNNRPIEERQLSGETPAAGRDDPEVQRLTDGYEPDAGGPDGWPDGTTNPDGFANPDAREPAVLQPGETIDRFGHNYGQYTSPTGEPYANRALPESNLDGGYRQFAVEKPLPVWRGEAAPAQGQWGGATQHYLPYPVVDLVDGGYLKQIYPPT